MRDRIYLRLLDRCQTARDLEIQTGRALRDPLGYVNGNWRTNKPPLRGERLSAFLTDGIEALEMGFSRLPRRENYYGSDPRFLGLLRILYADIAVAAARIRAAHAIRAEVPSAVHDPIQGILAIHQWCRGETQSARGQGGEKNTPNGPGETGETPIEHIQLENGAYKILHMLNSSPTRLQQEDLTLCEDPPMDRRTVSRHLKTLKEDGLIDYNPRNKKGAAITQKGRDYLNSLPK